MEQIKKKPIVFSLIVILSIILLNKIPISKLLASFSIPEFYSERVETLFINTIVVLCIIGLINSRHIPFGLQYKFKTQVALYYLPLIGYIYVFAIGGIDGIFNIDFSVIPSMKILTYTAEVFSAAFLEEVLFRGLVLGLLLAKWRNSKNGILKSVIVSGLIFGSIHLINIWTKPHGISPGGVFNQIYAAACFGVMYGATYIKTRNILILGVLHFLSNFFAGIGELEATETVVNAVARDKTTIEIVASEIFRLVIFGIPLLIGLFVLKGVSKEDVEEMMD